MNAPRPWMSLLSLAGRECLRVSRLWTQTMLAPVVSSVLFIVVFGLSLGGRISGIGEVPYDVFIVPGLAAMAMAQAAYSNNSSSIFQARSDRYIHDVLAAPMHPWQMNLGLSLGGAYRALVIGVVMAIAIPLTDAPVERPIALVAAALLLVILFGALGTVIGIYAETFDHHTFVNNIVILPLTFVGGVFYSIEVLLPLGGDLAPEPDLLHGQLGPLRLSRDQRRQRRALLRGDGSDRGGHRRVVAIPFSTGRKLKA